MRIPGILRDINAVLVVLLAFTLSLIPLTNDRFYIYIASLFMIYSLFALSYNLLFGYAGLLSFGHAMFFATGAYTTALFTLKLYRDPLIGLIAGVIASIPLALIIGLLSLRHTRVYFAILTLAFGMLIHAILVKWRSVTGGSDGLIGIPKKGIILDISSPQAYYFFILTFFILASLGLYAFIRSRWGLLVKALGANEDRLPFVGHSVLIIRLYTFAISGLVAALSGSLYSIFMGVITPDIAYWTFSAEPLVMTLLGGSTYYMGPVLGAFIFIALTTILARFAEYWLLLLGLAVIAVVIGFRGGVAEALVSTVDRFRKTIEVRRVWRSFKVENLSKSFGEFKAVDNISFSLKEFELTALIGPNGAGKTTLVNLITRKLKPDSGRILFQGMDITGLGAHKITRLGIARTFQIVSLFPTLTVYENLKIPASTSGTSARDVIEILSKLGLERFKDVKVAKLPFGIQKLVELGVVLTLKPKLLILDEPVAGLAQEDRRNLMSILKDMGRRVTLMIIEHDMEFVFGLAERVIVMNRGKIIADGKPEEIAENKLVREIYLGEG